MRRGQRLAALAGLILGVIHCHSSWADVVYQSDFESPVASEWSNTSISVTPVGGRNFLGPLGAGTTTLTLNGLPDNQSVTVEFDLYVINTWDGNQLIDPLSEPPHTVGPDVWSVDVGGGPRQSHQNLRARASATRPVAENSPTCSLVTAESERKMAVRKIDCNAPPLFFRAAILCTARRTNK